MANVFYLETKDDVDVLQKYLAEDDIIIALSPPASYALEKKGLRYKLLEDEYYSHLELHRVLAGYNESIENIMKYIDDIIFKIDHRFKELHLGPFYCSLFDTEVPVLNIITRLFQIKSVFEKEKPYKVKIIDQGRFISEGVRFDESKGSLINEIIKLLRRRYNYELVIYESSGIDAKKGLKIAAEESKGFKDITIKMQEVSMLHLRKLKHRTLNHALFFISKLFMSKRRNKILSVDCRELESIKNKLMKKGWVIYTFPYVEFNRNKIKRGYRFKDRFEQMFKADDKLKELFKFSGISYFEIISRQLLNFCDCFEGMLNDYYWLDSYLKYNKFDIVFFQTHSGWKTQNKLSPVILKENNIPYVCWMHGGYGANKAVSGWASCDYLLGDRYFVYGDRVKDVIDTHYPAYDLKTYVAGSPFLENRYRNYIKPKNKKKIITYVLSVFSYPLNEAYTTECVRYKMFGYWLPIRDTLKVLFKYQDDYCIRIRPFLDTMQIRLLNEYLKDMGAGNIAMISMEQALLKDVLFKTDLAIYNNVSTSFFEAALTSADIFLLDDSDLTENAERAINKRAFHFREVQDFCENLDGYLKEGNFYQKNDNAFIKEFLDIDNRGNRADKISDTLDSILTG